MRALTFALVAVVLSACAPRSMGAAAIVRPFAVPVLGTDLPHEDLSFRSAEGLTLRGWLFRPVGESRGVVVFLHGKDANRRQGLLAAKTFVPRGWTVLLYDQRAHGESEGSFVTYGAKEKDDLRRALDAVGAKRAVAMGVSLGGATVLQAAPEDPRIVAVVALASFAELEAIIRETAGPLASNEELMRNAVSDAESAADFRVDDVSPRRAAEKIEVPVLLVHGSRDAFTDPSHSRRLYEALHAPKRLMIVQGATHYDVQDHPQVWAAIGRWLAETVEGSP